MLILIREHFRWDKKLKVFIGSFLFAKYNFCYQHLSKNPWYVLRDGTAQAIWNWLLGNPNKTLYLATNYYPQYPLNLATYCATNMYKQ